VLDWLVGTWSCLYKFIFTSQRGNYYIKGTLDYDMLYASCDNSSFMGYTDSDWASDVGDRRSTSSNAFF